RRIWCYPGVKAFSGLILCVIVILLSFFLLATSRTPEIAFFWARLRFLGLTLSPVAFLFFSLDYTERKIPYRHLLLAGLLIIPVLTQTIIWSNYVIPWFFSEWSLGQYGFLTTEQSRFGIAFQFHAIQSYLLLAVSFYFLIMGILDTKAEYRMSLNWILTGGILTVIGTAIPSVAGNIFPLNIGPIGMSASLMTFSWGILRHHLFDTVAAAQHSVFSNLQDAVIVLNNHGEIIQHNPAAGRILGEAAPQQYQSIQQILARQSQTEALEQTSFEVTINERVFDARFSPLNLNRFNAGRILVLRDITLQKTMTEALRESEALYRLLAENSSDMIMLNKLDGQFVYASPSCSQQMGYADTEELVAQAEKDITAFVHPDDWASSAEWYRRVVQGEQLDLLEYRLVRKDGTAFWVEVQARPIHDENGDVYQVMSVHRDIDERKQIQEALQKSNQRFETLVRNIPAMVYQIKRTPQGEYRFEYVSPTSVKFVGHPPEAILENSALIF
ncbi:MAG: PAS domain S-box protein, partial [Anaerolineae bacterium]|nr:PAS domain S-box protein [Anaerolineae bacterium]